MVSVDPDVDHISFYEGQRTYLFFNFSQPRNTNYDLTIFTTNGTHFNDVPIGDIIPGRSMYHLVQPQSDNGQNMLTTIHVLLINGAPELDDLIIQCRYTNLSIRLSPIPCENVSIVMTFRRGKHQKIYTWVVF